MAKDSLEGNLGPFFGFKEGFMMDSFQVTDSKDILRRCFPVSAGKHSEYILSLYQANPQ